MPDLRTLPDVELVRTGCGRARTSSVTITREGDLADAVQASRDHDLRPAVVDLGHDDAFRAVDQLGARRASTARLTP